MADSKSPKKPDDERRDEIRRRRLTILETSLDCIVSVDDDGNVREWNPAAEKAFGLHRTEAVGKSFVDLVVPGPDRGQFLAQLSELEAGERGRRFETQLMAGPDKTVPVEISVTADELDGAKIKTVYLRDISDRKRSEAELAAARDEAVEASKLKSQFLATISHELRTPLNGILGMAALLLNSELDESQRSYAKAIQESGNALHGIIADLLNFSEVDQGKVLLKPVDFPLQHLIERTTAGFAERASAKGIEIACELGDGLPLTVHGDGVRIAQILGCLLDNAIKFTGAGTIDVRASVSERQGTNVVVRLEVEDSGSGIPESRLKSLFQPFVQGDGSSTRRYGGTGLGLSICNELLTLMDGDIRIESEEGKGTRVACMIPLRIVVDAPADQSAETTAATGKRVLVVDTNKSSREVLVGYLWSWRFRTDVAEGSGEALTKLIEASRADDPFELVVLASKIAVESGIEVAQSISSDDRFSDLPLLLLTGAGEACPIEEASRAGVSRLLPKPVSRSQLYNAVVELTEANAKPAEAVTIPATAARLEGPMTCLVVEDNIINQQVLTAMLESMGHVVHMADNGREAVEAFQPGFFDIIFMDIQMPEMDGYEATGRIRMIEHGKLHTPIVAVTANAMKGDREICIDAGMDDYVPKPVDPMQLQAAIERVCERFGGAESADTAQSGRQAGGAQEEQPMSATIDLSVLDNLRAFQREGQPDIVTRLIDLFLGQAPSHIEAIEEALRQRDAVAAGRSGHALKGAAANLGATRLTELAARIEELGRTGELDEAGRVYADLCTEFSLVESELNAQRRPTEGGAEPTA